MSTKITIKKEYNFSCLHDLLISKHKLTHEEKLRFVYDKFKSGDFTENNFAEFVSYIESTVASNTPTLINHKWGEALKPQ